MTPPTFILWRYVMIDFLKRENMIPVVHRNIANNITKDVFGQKTIKLKKCSCCGFDRPYSDFYRKAGKQNIHRDSISINDIRNYCINCYDWLNKTYNKGSRPKPIITSTIENFICEEVSDNA